MKDMMTVRLENCRFFAFHGVMPRERRCGNEFEVSVAVDYSVTLPADDLLEGTVSYADIYEIVKEEMAVPRQLLETVARAISARIEAQYPVSNEIRVTIRKLTPPIPGITGSASVTFKHLTTK